MEEKNRLQGVSKIKQNSILKEEIQLKPDYLHSLSPVGQQLLGTSSNHLTIIQFRRITAGDDDADEEELEENCCN